MIREQEQTSAPLPTQFGLLRHGMTVWNEEKRIQGRLDSPLSEAGREYIQNFIPTLKRYQWQRIFASDLGRVQQTVAIINKVLNLPVSYDKRLREINWGTWEGQRLADVKTDYATELSKQEKKGWDFQAPEGESRRELLDRTIEALLEAEKQWRGENILVVCHLGVIKCLVYNILDRAFVLGDRKLLRKDALHIISRENEVWNCKELNIKNSGLK